MPEAQISNIQCWFSFYWPNVPNTYISLLGELKIQMKVILLIDSNIAFKWMNNEIPSRFTSVATFM